MNHRVRCRSCKDYHRYGGRGITITPAWNVFATFLADMGAKLSSKHTLDRIDSDGPYSKENRRWATRAEQQYNTRKAKFKPHHIRRIRKLRKETPLSLREIGLVFQTDSGTISSICSGKNGKRLSEAPSVFGNRRRGHVLRLALHNTKGCREMSAMNRTIISPARR